MIGRPSSPIIDLPFLSVNGTRLIRSGCCDLRIPASFLACLNAPFLPTFPCQHSAEYSQSSIDLQDYLTLMQNRHPEDTHLTLTDRPSLMGLPIVNNVVR